MDSQFKINNFDLLRIFAATQVVLAHSLHHLQVAMPAWWSIVDAFPGVSIFFAISGYLISASFERSSSLRSYGRNRVLRIYPGLWCCVFVTIIVASLFGFAFFNRPAAVWLVSQLIGGIYTPGFLKSFGFGSYNGSLWTIPIELQFYCVLPLFYWFTKKLRTSAVDRAFWVYWAIFLIVALMSSLVIAPLTEVEVEPLPQKLFRYSFVPHIYLFLTGVLLQRLGVYRSRWIAGKFLYWLAVYLVVYYVVPYSPVVSVGEMLLLAVVAVSAAYTSPTLTRRLLRGHDVSYGVYIYHGLLLNVFVELGIMHRPVYIALVVVGAFIAGFLSWIGVERRFLHAKKQSNAPEYAIARR